MLRLWRQRQVLLIPLVDEMQSVQVRLWYPLTMSAIPERLRDASSIGATQINITFTFTYIFQTEWYQHAQLCHTNDSSLSALNCLFIPGMFCLFVCLGFNGTFSTNRLYRAIHTWDELTAEKLLLRRLSSPNTSHHEKCMQRTHSTEPCAQTATSLYYQHQLH